MTDCSTDSEPTRVIGPLRVVTLPAAHAYLEAVVPVGVDRVDTRGVGSPAWSPDLLWDPERWNARAADIDVVHVHFGFDHVAPAVLEQWVDVTRRNGVRLVVTVHDLHNPHQRDPAVLDAQWAVLVPAADALLTLTSGAAREILRRFGRTAEVVAHPAIFDGPAHVVRDQGLVGVHLKSFRRNLGDDLVPALRAVEHGALAAGGRLRIDLHEDVRDDPRARAVRDAFAGRPSVEVRFRPRLDDASLRRYLSALDVSVQLHRWGTHSGWVEACHDVGTAVVAPDVGFLRQQWPQIHSYPTDPDVGPELSELRAAVAVAVRARPPVPAARGWRRAQLAEVREIHRRAYAA